MRNKILVLICFFSINLFSQDSLKNKFILKTDLISYFPSWLGTGKANIEIEKPFQNKNSLLLHLAYIYSYGSTPPYDLIFIEQEKTRGFLMALEFRHYFNRQKVFEPLCLLIWPLIFQLHSIKNNNSGLYISGQASYQQTFSDILKSPKDLNEGTYSVNRINPSLIARIGFQSVSKKKRIFDQSFGLGIQYIKCFSDSSFDTNLISSMYSYRNTSFFPMFNYSLKIGLTL